MKSISRMDYLIINKNLDPPCKIISKTHFFFKKKRERERKMTRIVLNLTKLQFLLLFLLLFLSCFVRFTGTTRRSKTIERGNSLRETIGRQGERVRREDKSLSVLHVKR